LEYWRALKALGVDTQFVIFAGEGHSLRKPENKRDYKERTIKWFDKYLKPNQ